LQISAEPTLFDWSNPDSWKPATDLVTDWKTLGGFGLAIVGALWRWGSSLWRRLVSKLHRAKPAAPTVAPAAERPLIFVADDHRTTHGPVGADEKTGTHVIGIWHVTNVTDRNFVLLKVRLGNYVPKMPVAIGVQGADGRYELKGPLPAHGMSTVMIELVFEPSVHHPHEGLVADVIFTDNYGDEHPLPSVRFRRMGPLTSPPFAQLAQAIARSAR
jgi:hypothetical protein